MVWGWAMVSILDKIARKGLAEMDKKGSGLVQVGEIWREVARGWLGGHIGNFEVW